jgi:hypothetical protein
MFPAGSITVILLLILASTGGTTLARDRSIGVSQLAKILEVKLDLERFDDGADERSGFILQVVDGVKPALDSVKIPLPT